MSILFFSVSVDSQCISDPYYLYLDYFNNHLAGASKPSRWQSVQSPHTSTGLSVHSSKIFNNSVAQQYPGSGSAHSDFLGLLIIETVVTTSYSFSTVSKVRKEQALSQWKRTHCHEHLQQQTFFIAMAVSHVCTYSNHGKKEAQLTCTPSIHTLPISE